MYRQWPKIDIRSLPWPLFLFYFKAGSLNWTQNLLMQQVQLENLLQRSHLRLQRLEIWEGHHAHPPLTWVPGNQPLIQITLRGRRFNHWANSLDLVGYYCIHHAWYQMKGLELGRKLNTSFLEKRIWNLINFKHFHEFINCYSRKQLLIWFLKSGLDNLCDYSFRRWKL